MMFDTIINLNTKFYVKTVVIVFRNYICIGYFENHRFKTHEKHISSFF